jgi:nickel-dependent lactate racemase
MNWSHSIVTFFSGGARVHPPGVAPEASVEYFDSSEVFYTLC